MATRGAGPLEGAAKGREGLWRWACPRMGGASEWAGSWEDQLLSQGQLQSLEVSRQGLWAREAWGGLDRAKSSSPLDRGRETLTAAWGLWQPLTIAEVQKLLGPNLEGLKAEEGNSPVRDWIFRQRQNDLDSLGLGLHGGIPNGYMVLDLSFRGGLGRLAGRGWDSEAEGLSDPSLRRGPLRGTPPRWTCICVHCAPSSAPGFDPELSRFLWMLNWALLWRLPPGGVGLGGPCPALGDRSSIKEHVPPPKR